MYRKLSDMKWHRADFVFLRELINTKKKIIFQFIDKYLKFFSVSKRPREYLQLEIGNKFGKT